MASEQLVKIVNYLQPVLWTLMSSSKQNFFILTTIDIMDCECNQGSRVRLIVGLIGGMILICVVVSFLTTRLMVNKSDWSQHDSEHGHKWLHQELNLSETEAALIDALEPAYREERAKLQGDFQERILTLRDLIVGSDELTPEVRHAIHELHIVHGRLQELSINHYYEMMNALPADKQKRLKEIAVQALSIPE
jgi:Spy/CpxP family protein refolding chaperone